jgi:arylsulfatase A-like enzyme
VLSVLVFGVLACGACDGEEADNVPRKRGRRKAEAGEGSDAPKDALVDWPPVPAALAASDAALIERELANVKTAAAGRPVPTVAGARAPDIVVIVLDTVRADHLGVYGYDRATTPRLDAWAAGARVYEQAWTNAPWTLPAHASMFTGLPQRQHAARSVGLDDPRKGAPLADRFETVAERLQAAGYRTVAVTGNRAFLHPSFGLGQGFDSWVNETPADDTRGVPYTPADRIRPMAEAVLAQADDHPLFLFLNFMDAHTPYKARRGYVREPDRLIRRSLPGNGGGFRKVATKLLKGGVVDPEVQASWVEAYDAELRFLDEHVGALLAGVRAPHVYVLADHGEYLGEHSLVEHAKDVYEPVLHVPFLVRDPRQPPGRESSLVQVHDLAWMVLDAAGLPSADVERTGEVAVSELVYTLKKDLESKAYGARFQRIRRAFRVGPHKLIVGTDGSREQYDLGADPGELDPRAALPPIFDDLDTRWLAAHPEAEVVPASQSGALGPDEEALKALGYAD